MGSIPVGDFGFLSGFHGNLDFGCGGNGGLTSSSLVLDREKGELVRAPSRIGGKGGSSGSGRGGGLLDGRAPLGLKSHSEAERRRRERINSHLATLRSLLPFTAKMDKAALLAEVITQVKELKNRVTEIGNRCSVPTDTDGVMVESFGGDLGGGSFLIKASICCEDKPDLITDLTRVLQSLNARNVRAEISTLGGRVMVVLVMACEGSTNGIEKHLVMSSVHQALNDAIGRVCSQVDDTPRAFSSGKRRRISPIDCSSSSS